MSLVNAEKGILLSDHETTADQREVVCFSGFENDPQDSAIAQRSANEVIERDATIREMIEHASMPRSEPRPMKRSTTAS